MVWVTHKRMPSSVMEVLSGLRGWTDLERWLCLLRNKTWQRGLVTSESCGRVWGSGGGVREGAGGRHYA